MRTSVVRPSFRVHSTRKLQSPVRFSFFTSISNSSFLLCCLLLTFHSKFIAWSLCVLQLFICLLISLHAATTSCCFVSLCKGLNAYRMVVALGRTSGLAARCARYFYFLKNLIDFMCILFY